MFENITTHQHKINVLENYFSKIYLVKNKFYPEGENYFDIIIRENNLNEDEMVSIGDNFYTDIYPSYLCRYKLIFYLHRKNSYIGHFSMEKNNILNASNIITIDSLAMVKNYIG